MQTRELIQKEPDTVLIFFWAAGKLNTLLTDEVTQLIKSDLGQTAIDLVTPYQVGEYFLKTIRDTKRAEVLRHLLIDMSETGVLPKYIPELEYLKNVEQNIHHDFDVWNHTLESLTKAPHDLIVRLAVLFHDIAKPVTQTFKSEEYGYSFFQHNVVGAGIFKLIARRLGFVESNVITKDEVERIACLITNHLHFNVGKPVKLLKRLRIDEFGDEILTELKEVMKADIQGRQTLREEELRRLHEKFTELKDYLDNPQQKIELALNGNDLITELKLEPSPELGKIIKTLRQKVHTKELPNTRDDLLNYVKTNLY
jgi:hypothetical protein